MQCRCCIWFGYLCCFKCVVISFYCVVCVTICIPVICVIVRVSLQKTACSKWPSLFNDDGNAEPPVCDEVTFSLSSCDEHTVFSKAMRHPTPELVFHGAVCIHLILRVFSCERPHNLVGFYESSHARKLFSFFLMAQGVLKFLLK